MSGVLLHQSDRTAHERMAPDAEFENIAYHTRAYQDICNNDTPPHVSTLCACTVWDRVRVPTILSNLHFDSRSYLNTVQY